MEVRVDIADGRAGKLHGKLAVPSGQVVACESESDGESKSESQRSDNYYTPGSSLGLGSSSSSSDSESCSYSFLARAESPNSLMCEREGKRENCKFLKIKQRGQD